MYKEFQINRTNINGGCQSGRKVVTPGFQEWFASNRLQHTISMAAVASSRIRILVLRSNALARHINCRWPTEKLAPPSVTSWSRPPSRCWTCAFKWACSRAIQSSWSLVCPVGSRLKRTLPVNRTGSWGIMVNLKWKLYCKKALKSVF